MLRITCYSRCSSCHVERSETSFAPFRLLSSLLFESLSFLSLCSSDFVDCDRVFLLFGTLSFRPSLSLSFRPSAPHCHVERSETSFTPFRPLSFRPSGASGEIWYVVRGTVVGIYGLRRLQRRRCGDLDPKGLSSRLAVARISPPPNVHIELFQRNPSPRMFRCPRKLQFYGHVMPCL